MSSQDTKKHDDFAIEMNDLEREQRDRLLPRDPSAVQAPSSGSYVSPQSQGAASILSYCLSSILMTTTNKYVLSGQNYNLNFLLLAVQSIVCVLAIEGLKGAKIITYRNFNTQEAKKWFPISLLLVGMIYTSTWAIKYLSIPVYTIFKNLTIILIAYGEVLWFGGTVTSLALLSFGLMVLSSVVAAWADIQHALSTRAAGAGGSVSISELNTGYLWMFANCFCTTAYILGQRKRIKLTNFKDYDTMFYNNLLTIPVLVIASLVVEDWSSANVARNFPPETRNRIIFAMALSGLSSVFISYSSAWCLRITSSTTYSMVGALNKLPLAICGLVFFDAPVTFGSVTAIFIGFVSGLVYAKARINQNRDKDRALPTSSSGPMISASSQSLKDGLRG